MSKIIQTPQQRANTLEALNVMWPSVPPKNVYRQLADFREGNRRTAPDCGTVACFGGWCAWWPSFVDQGIKVGCGGKPVIAGFDWAADASKHLFSYPQMFAGRDGHPADKRFTGTDHELVTHRLQWLLDNSEVQP